MDLKDRIQSFAELGTILRDSLQGKQTEYTDRLNQLIENQQFKNPWFTPSNVRQAFSSIAEELTYDNLVKWTSSYPDLEQPRNPVRAGVIMAGNIPLVGFHDFLSVLISGNSIIAKTSSKDSDLIRFIGQILCGVDPRFDGRIEFTDGTLNQFDVVIATGSDNSSRYFEYYFGKYPHVIRKNRNSVAVLTGDESDTELENLGKDVFSYFGLGCRNVSKIYLPAGYDLPAVSKHWQGYSDLINNVKYANNYDFHKAVYLVNREEFTDIGLILLKESKNLSSPVAVLYFEYYTSDEQLEQTLNGLKDKIQCVIGKDFIPFGQSQSPSLWDYADGIDTIEFLLKKNSPGIL
ncbi:MAG TPA: acyl-CoA reductase [Bacteroidales bacterium]|jgi:hypothetical protein|nr:acyl-CoA reductase [Bacteroidales bacterium]HOU02800.1 acyl-CoA reductase [Bacteroidales bacterium]HQG63538.1 acyl-CoA reductase [Bacteroidales bacterium]HQK68796.1 acyl-CoA reductase [Bacteroidales bacterium]